VDMSLPAVEIAVCDSVELGSYKFSKVAYL